MIKRRSEKGQAIILITFAMIGLIGLTALAIDGGDAYSDRRQAQNAADTAAFSGALAKIRYPQPSDESGVQAAIWNAVSSRAASNGYDNDGINNTVQYFDPPTSGQFSCDVTPSTCHDYIQVVITSNVKTLFARVVGVDHITNYVEAVARAKLGTVAPMFGGSAVVALDPDGCKALTYSGNANVTLLGTGLFSNSTCSSAFYNSSNTAKTLTTPCLTTVGGYTYSAGKVVINPPSPNCPMSGAAAYSTSSYILPNPVCNTNAVQIGSVLTPGNWSGNFPPNSVTTLSDGLYCVSGNFSLSGGQSLSGNHVMIFMKTGKVSINTSGTVNLTATNSAPYKGLLLYMPPTNTSQSITINGGSLSVISGTILAPSATVNIVGGGSAAGGIQSQIIGYDVNLGGGSDTVLSYNADQNYQPPLPPSIELTK